MPTGYTCNIEKGETFKKFALNCARAFGACIDMRDEPFDTPIPDNFKVSTYHKDGIKKTEKKIAKIKKLTIKECNILSKKEWNKDEKQQQKYLKSKEDLRVKYEAMIKEVNDWIPPSEDHNGMKEFMLNQLQMSMVSDCEVHCSHGKLKSGKEWKKDQIKFLEEDLKYHKNHWIEEVERTNKRSIWVQKLKKSLEKYD